MHCVVTGAAGFIGSSLTDRLLAGGHSVLAVDNFSTGQERFIAEAMKSPRCKLARVDLFADAERLPELFRGAEMVFHLAANADVRFGTQHPRRDLEQNTIVTSNVLEGMRLGGVKRIAFSSTGSIYGEPEVFPTPEHAPFPLQTSLYGASKLAAEGMIQAYCEGFGVQGLIFRFVSILGERYTHGHVFDFYRQLKEHPDRLDVLGDGSQRKSYLYIQDCLDAIMLAMEKAGPGAHVYNLGTDEYCMVRDSIGWITSYLGLAPKLVYAGGKRGWIGDSPFIFLDCAKMRGLGWKPALSIRQGVIRTVEFLQANPWVLEERK